MQAHLKREIKQGLLVFALLVVLSIIASFPLPIKPNIYIVGIVVYALTISDPLLCGAFILGVLGLAKYTPVATPELLVLGIGGMVFWVIRKMFIREAQPLLMGIGVLVLQAVFWSFFASHQSFGITFFMEFFYNVLILLIVYSVWVWAKKIFS